MNNFFYNLKYKLQQFMIGRYGYDEMSRDLTYMGLACYLLYLLFFRRSIVYYASMGLYFWAIYRSLSRDFSKRQQERIKFLQAKSKALQKLNLAKGQWNDRKTHNYYTCPHCGASVRIRKPAKGLNINITCPRCGQQFQKRT